MKRAPKFRKSSIIPTQVISFYIPLFSHQQLLINTILFFITLVTGGIGLFSDDKDFFWYLSTVSFIVFIWNIIRYWTFDKSYEIMTRQDINYKSIEPSDLEKKSYYQSEYIESQNDAIIYSNKVNQYLIDNIQNIKLHLIENRSKDIFNKFRNKDIELYKNILLNQHKASLKNNQEFRNDEKISMDQSIYLDKPDIDVFKSCYFLSYLTNDLVMKKIYDISNNVERIKKHHHIEFINDDDLKQQIKSINELDFSNHIGVNVLGITKDGFMQLWVQSTKALRSMGLLAPTGSGSLDYKDFDLLYKVNKEVFLKELIISGMKRELLEESHSVNELLDETFIKEIKVIGYYRWVGKGGLPAFLGVAKLSVNQNKIKPNISEVYIQDDLETKFPAHDLPSLKKSIEKLLNNYKVYLSVPLYANLISLKNAIEFRAENFDFLFDKN